MYLNITMYNNIIPNLRTIFNINNFVENLSYFFVKSKICVT